VVVAVLLVVVGPEYMIFKVPCWSPRFHVGRLDDWSLKLRQHLSLQTHNFNHSEPTTIYIVVVLCCGTAQHVGLNDKKQLKYSNVVVKVVYNPRYMWNSVLAAFVFASFLCVVECIHFEEEVVSQIQSVYLSKRSM
jgi:hypothetical protein